MGQKRNRIRVGLTVWLPVVASFGLCGCVDGDTTEETRNILSAQEALYPTDDAILAKTMAPVRPLVDPEKVYMTSVAATYEETGTLRHTFHIFNPTGGGGVNFELVALTQGGAVDFSHRFTEVEATPIIDGEEGASEFFPDGAGRAAYSTATSEAGWYRVHFHYEAANAGRTLVFTSTDDSDDSLMIGWDDPAGEDVRIRATFVADQTLPVYFKGGAYRNSLPIMHAFADEVRVDGHLLYRQGFDQGQFNFPLGIISAGEHELTFTLTNSGDLKAKFWFGVNETGFDLLGSQTEWSRAQFLYDGEMRTGDYDAWNEGVAFAQGETLTYGVRPPPVRRGTTFAIGLDDPSLAGPWMNAILRIYPFGNGSETNWPTERPAAQDYTGGIFTANGLETRYREHWRVSVPEDAPVGRYVVKAIAPNGRQVGDDVLFYVIHNPYKLWWDSLISPAHLRTYGYDEDADGMNMEHDEEMDLDNDDMRDHFIAMYTATGDDQFYQKTFFTGAFRRTYDDMEFSMLDYAVAAADGTTSEFETMRRLYRIVSQRYWYGGKLGSTGDVSQGFIGDSSNPDFGFTPEHARIYSKPGNDLPMSRRTQTMCYGTAAALASIARPMGILSRMMVSRHSLGWWGDHAFTEAFIPDLPRHDGKVAPYSWSEDSDTDHWYVFDATNPQGGLDVTGFTTYSEAVGPRSQFGRATEVLRDGIGSPISVVTNNLTWDPLLSDFDTTSEVWDFSDEYVSGSEFWLTQSGVTGWIGVGEKDVFRINRSLSGARAVRVRSLPNGGEYLVPKLCVVTPSDMYLSERCTDAGTHQNLPYGDAYVVVFNDTENTPAIWGDSIQYVLELEY